MRITTVTINPALDKSTTVNQVVPEQKMRCKTPKYDAGGGGINVSRVVKRLGGNPQTIYQSSGPAGSLIDKLLEKENIHCVPFFTQEWTRENFIVVDESTGNQYRFGMSGPTFSKEEILSTQQLIKQQEQLPEILVLSGSLPPGVPDDFYANICYWAKEKGIITVLDTSGPSLIKAMEVGVTMVKPNLKELCEIMGKEQVSGSEQEELAMELVNNGKANYVAVSMGPRGAMLASSAGIQYVTSPTIIPKSTVGAGDSMVAGMVWAMSEGKEPLEMLRYGVSCGTAATMNVGTELSKVEDINKVYNWILDHPTNQ